MTSDYPDRPDHRGRATSSDPSSKGASNTTTAAPGRVALAVGLVYLAAVVILITTRVSDGHLPDPLPTHWGTDGVDSVASRAGYAQTLFWITLVIAVVSTVVALVRRLHLAIRKWVVVALGSAAWLLAGVWVATVGASWGVARAQDVELSWWLLVMLGLTAGGAIAVERAFGRTPVLRRANAVTVPGPVADLQPGERVAWAERLGSHLFTALAAAIVVVGVVFLVGGAPVGAAVALFVGGIAVVLFTSVRLSVDRRGFVMGLGPFGWPRKTIPLDAIADARAQEIIPLQWGGWGYRIIPGGSALVLRRGPGLVIEQHDGRRFAVTIDHPEVPAGLLNALRIRQPQ